MKEYEKQMFGSGYVYRCRCGFATGSLKKIQLHVKGHALGLGGSSGHEFAEDPDGPGVGMKKGEVQ